MSATCGDYQYSITPTTPGFSISHNPPDFFLVISTDIGEDTPDLIVTLDFTISNTYHAEVFTQADIVVRG